MLDIYNVREMQNDLDEAATFKSNVRTGLNRAIEILEEAKVSFPELDEILQDLLEQTN